MKKIRAFLAAAFVSGTALAQIPVLEFKGLAPGGDASVVTTHAAWDCKPQRLSGSDTVCMRRHETIAGADTNLVMVGAKDGKILTVVVSFSQGDFSRVHEALVAKYGQPAKSQKDVKRNRLGAEFLSQVSEWRQQGVYMKAEERTSKVDSSMVLISSDVATRESEQQRKQITDQNKSDL